MDECVGPRERHRMSGRLLSAHFLLSHQLPPLGIVDGILVNVLNAVGIGGNSNIRRPEIFFYSDPLPFVGIASAA